MAHLVFCLLLLFPAGAWAFNPIILMDPYFHAFLLIYLPFVGGVLVSVWEAVAFRVMFKQAYGWKQALRITLLQNVWAVLFYVLVAIMAMYFASEPLLDAENSIPIVAGCVYFGATFIYFSWKRKMELVKKYVMDVDKKMSAVIFVVNACSFIALYTYLYVRL
jgi:hypothetical protein